MFYCANKDINYIYKSSQKPIHERKRLNFSLYMTISYLLGFTLLLFSSFSLEFFIRSFGVGEKHFVGNEEEDGNNTDDTTSVDGLDKRRSSLQGETTDLGFIIESLSSSGGFFLISLFFPMVSNTFIDFLIVFVDEFFITFQV